MSKIKLGQITLDARDSASQGSAILGIRDSGKSYTATMMAEQYMMAGIPIIAFDPIGLWRFLRVAGKGAGFPVVVAGGEHGDLPLTPQSAPEIVRAAMRGGVSLVLDLYSMELSKADWKRIVESSLAVLLYENKKHGLRHVFIEEAAEFCPQIMPKDGLTGKVYDQVERLARMGGNALLGYTLINQRAEQVNKAVLELCDNLYLHRQKGKNSISSLAKWLDVAGAKAGREITDSLPTLGQGECWAWVAGSTAPVRLKMPAKQTFHPDRRAMHATAGKAEHKTVDVGQFVSQMSATLAAVKAEAEANDPKALRAQIAELEKKLKAQPAAGPDKAELSRLQQVAFQEGWKTARMDGVKELGALIGAVVAAEAHFRQSLDALERWLNNSREGLRAADAVQPVERAVSILEVEGSRPVVLSIAARPKKPIPAPTQRGDINGPQQRILDALAWWASAGIHQPSRIQVAVVARYSPTGGAFQNPLGSLRTMGLVDYPAPGVVALTEAGEQAANPPSEAVTVAELHSRLQGILNGPQWRILAPALEAYPSTVSRAHLAAAAGYAPDGGAFQNPLGSLRTLGLIDYPQPGQVVAMPVCFLEGR